MSPQPIDKVSSKAEFILTTEALVDRPMLSNIVTQIFALWTVAEQEFQVLFSRMVGPDERVSEAVFSALQSEGIQRSAMTAAAKVKFGNGSDQYTAFKAVINVYLSASKIRHKLAHWRWGVSPQMPDALLLADPKATKPVLKTMSHMRSVKPLDGQNRPERTKSILENITYDRSKILVFTIKDLERGLSDLEQSVLAFYHFDLYTNPLTTEQEASEMKLRMGPEFAKSIEIGTSAEALRQLSCLSLFREAHHRLQETHKN